MSGLNIYDYFFIYLFYFSFVIFIIGSIYVLVKWIFTSKGKTNSYLGLPYLFTYPGQNTAWSALKNILGRIFLFSSIKYDRKTRYVAALFHWSLWIVIAAHFDMFVEKYIVALGIPASEIETIAFYAGNFFGILLIITGLYLFYRRLSNPYLRDLSTAGDYFALLLIVAFGFSGVFMRFLVSDTFAYDKVGPFIAGLFTGSFAPMPMVPIFIIHFLLACTILIYYPLGKFMHMYSFFTNPTLYTIFHAGEANEKKF